MLPTGEADLDDGAGAHCPDQLRHLALSSGVTARPIKGFAQRDQMDDSTADSRVLSEEVS
jgi:hypothetical protein